MDVKGFQFNDDMTLGTYLEVTRIVDTMEQFMQIAAELSALGKAAFLAQVALRPAIEAFDIITTVASTYLQHLAEAGKRIAEHVNTARGSG